jgi:beta-N-acetylglucosaminidase
MAARCGLKVSFQTQLLHLFQMAADAQHNVEINEVIEFCHSKWETKMGRSKIAKASIGRKQKILLQLSA